MNAGAVIVGLILIILSIFLTIFTLGFGIFCAAPIFIIGLIIFIVGLVVSDRPQQVVYYPAQQAQQPQICSRFCPSCGRAIPPQANVCPYCARRF